MQCEHLGGEGERERRGKREGEEGKERGRERKERGRERKERGKDVDRGEMGIREGGLIIIKVEKLKTQYHICRIFSFCSQVIVQTFKMTGSNR